MKQSIPFQRLLLAALCAVAFEAVLAEPRSGEQVYTQKCAMCHSTGAKGIPRIGDVPAWIPIIEKGSDVLYGRLISGFKGHPPMGLCMDCNDSELKAAVDYLVQQSQ